MHIDEIIAAVEERAAIRKAAGRACRRCGYQTPMAGTEYCSEKCATHPDVDDEPQVPWDVVLVVELEKLRAELDGEYWPHEAKRLERVTAGRDQEIELLQALVYLLMDDDPCIVDDGGGCKAHDFSAWGPKDMCPHAVARAVLPLDFGNRLPVDLRAWAKG